MNNHLQDFPSHMVGITQTPPWLHLVPPWSSVVSGNDTIEQQEPVQGSGELGPPARATGTGGLVTLWVAGDPVGCPGLWQEPIPRGQGVRLMAWT